MTFGSVINCTCYSLWCNACKFFYFVIISAWWLNQLGTVSYILFTMIYSNFTIKISIRYFLCSCSAIRIENNKISIFVARTKDLRPSLIGLFFIPWVSTDLPENLIIIPSNAWKVPRMKVSLHDLALTWSTIGLIFEHQI